MEKLAQIYKSKITYKGQTLYWNYYKFVIDETGQTAEAIQIEEHEYRELEKDLKRGPGWECFDNGYIKDGWGMGLYNRTCHKE